MMTFVWFEPILAKHFHSNQSSSNLSSFGCFKPYYYYIIAFGANSREVCALEMASVKDVPYKVVL